jgi:D-3-phosphoglycerate dehydrogenase
MAMKVLIPQDIESAGKIYLKDKGYEVIIGSGHDAETIKREVADCDAILARTAPYPADVIAAGKKLKIIARFGVGTDNIDVKFAEEQGVWVTIAKGANSHSVAEHTVTMMLACARNLIFIDRETKSGNWEIRNKFPITELKGKTVGIIGLGDIGRKVAAIVQSGLQMNVIGYAVLQIGGLPEYIEVVSSADEIFTRSDVVTLHIPATPESKNLVNQKTLSMMKPTAYLINCARGGIVNEDDLYEALKARKIVCAAMDVFLEEPAKQDNKLFKLDNFIASPHNAALTNESNREVSLSCARAIDDVLSGRAPEHPINNPRK